MQFFAGPELLVSVSEKTAMISGFRRSDGLVVTVPLHQEPESGVEKIFYHILKNCVHCKDIKELVIRDGANYFDTNSYSVRFGGDNFPEYVMTIRDFNDTFRSIGARKILGTPVQNTVKRVSKYIFCMELVLNVEFMDGTCHQLKAEINAEMLELLQSDECVLRRLAMEQLPFVCGHTKLSLRVTRDSRCEFQDVFGQTVICFVSFENELCDIRKIRD